MFSQTQFLVFICLASLNIASVDAICESQNSTDVVNMITNAPQTSNWLESGFVTIDDQTWVQVSTTSVHFSDGVAFVSLPEISGATAAVGFNTSYSEFGFYWASKL